jgi:hypothetical protein
VGAVYVDIAGQTGPAFRQNRERLYAEDRFHPDAAGYRLWAEAVIDQLRRRGGRRQGDIVSFVRHRSGVESNWRREGGAV